MKGRDIMVNKRSIGVAIVLSLVTCGLYSIYWFIAITNEVNTLTRRHDTSGGVAFLLTLVTCGIYSLYWYYKMGEKVDLLKTDRGAHSSGTGILYLILGILGLGLISYALIQDEINTYA